MVDLARAQQWFNSMEKIGQADAPFHFGPYTLTPRQLLQHANANDDLWKKVQNYM
jgi:hypothetical protein